MVNFNRKHAKENRLVSADDSITAVKSLGELNLPVPSIEQMKKEILTEKPNKE